MKSPTPPTRRAAILRAAALAASTCSTHEATAAVADTPFDWTLFWRGDDVGSSRPSMQKQRGLPPSEVAAILERDLRDNKYILTGQLTRSVFSDGCRFVDPNNAVDGLSKYTQALSLLFRPEQSTLEGVSVAVKSDRSGGSPVIIEADYTASGVLKLPWSPKIEPWAGHITYTLDADGLVVSQVDVWNITRWDALRQTFTPRS